MTLQQLTDYYDNHPDLQEEIRSDVWRFGKKKNPFKNESQRGDIY